MRPTGDVSGYPVYVSVEVADRLIASGTAKDVDRVRTMIKQHGKSVAIDITKLQIDIDQRLIHAFTIDAKFLDPMVFRAMDSSMLDRASIYYDFPNRNMCIDWSSPSNRSSD